MPATVKPLSDTAIRNAKPQDKAYTIPDGLGLYIRIAPTGAKTWTFRYVRPDTQQQNYQSFGAYPEISLAQARQKREEARALLQAGTDPQVHREAQRQAVHQAQADALTLGGVATDWLAHKAKTDAPATAKKRGIITRKHILPGLGQWPIRAITRPEIVTHLEAVNAVRPKLTGKVHEYLADIYEFSSNRGKTDTNPVPKLRGLFPVTPTRKNYAFIRDPVRLGVVLQLIEDYQGFPATRAAFRLLPYLMLRPGELRGLEKTEVFLDHPEGPRLAIARARMKARKGTAAERGPHIVPLPRQAVPILEEALSFSGESKYVFPSNSSPRSCLSEATLNQALTRRGVANTEQNPHGFRHAASTWLNAEAKRLGSQWSADEIERQLDHGDPDPIRGTYNKADYLDARRTMLQAYADYLDGLRSSPPR